MPKPLDRGRVVVDRHVNGELWEGRVVAPRERRALVLLRDFPYAANRAKLDAWLRYEVPGVAPLAFLGYEGEAAPSVDELRALRARMRSVPLVALVELRPDGEHLLESGRLTEHEVVRLGLGLCDTIVAWDEREPFLSAGLRPETVYVTGERGARRFAGATPRVHLMSYGDRSSFAFETYDPPAASRFELGVDDVGFTVALLLWFALLGEHAYVVPGHPFDGDNMFRDVRRPFGGPPELGRLLEAVLVADPTARLGARALRDGLLELAARWGVEPPPFPPPELAGQ